jgi:hypothetical protein
MCPCLQGAAGHWRQETQADWFDIAGQEPHVDLVLEVDVERVWEVMQAAVR